MYLFLHLSVHFCNFVPSPCDLSFPLPCTSFLPVTLPTSFPISSGSFLHRKSYRSLYSSLLHYLLPSFLPSLLSFSTDGLAFSPIYTSLFPSLFSFILSCVSPLFACRVLSTSHFVLFSRLRLQRGAGDERKSCERESRREKRKMEEGRRKDDKGKGRKERIHTSIHLFFPSLSFALFSCVSSFFACRLLSTNDCFISMSEVTGRGAWDEKKWKRTMTTEKDGRGKNER